MSRELRSVLVWLMMLALPVQGFAAAAMAGCAPGRPEAGPRAAVVGAAGHGAAAQVHDHHHTVAVELAATAGQAHHAMAVDAQDAPQTPVHTVGKGTAGDQDSAAGHDMLKCCSVTCSMVAMSDRAPLAAPQGRAVAPLHPLVSHYRGITLAGPERPPKTLLA